MPQVAFNAVSRAQRIMPVPNFQVSKEFAEALWAQQEYTMALQYLTELVVQQNSSSQSSTPSSRGGEARSQDVQERALLYAQLVSKRL